MFIRGFFVVKKFDFYKKYSKIQTKAACFFALNKNLVRGKIIMLMGNKF